MVIRLASDPGSFSENSYSGNLLATRIHVRPGHSGTREALTSINPDSRERCRPRLLQNRIGRSRARARSRAAAESANSTFAAALVGKRYRDS